MTNLISNTIPAYTLALSLDPIGAVALSALLAFVVVPIVIDLVKSNLKNMKGLRQRRRHASI